MHQRHAQKRVRRDHLSIIKRKQFGLRVYLSRVKCHWQRRKRNLWILRRNGKLFIIFWNAGNYNMETNH